MTSSSRPSVSNVEKMLQMWFVAHGKGIDRRAFMVSDNASPLVAEMRFERDPEVAAALAVDLILTESETAASPNALSLLLRKCVVSLFDFIWANDGHRSQKFSQSIPRPWIAITYDALRQRAAENDAYQKLRNVMHQIKNLRNHNSTARSICRSLQEKLSSIPQQISEKKNLIIIVTKRLEMNQSMTAKESTREGFFLALAELAPLLAPERAEKTVAAVGRCLKQRFDSIESSVSSETGITERFLRYRNRYLPIFRHILSFLDGGRGDSKHLVSSLKEALNRSVTFGCAWAEKRASSWGWHTVVGHISKAHANAFSIVQAETLATISSQGGVRQVFGRFRKMHRETLERLLHFTAKVSSQKQADPSAAGAFAGERAKPSANVRRKRRSSMIRRRRLARKKRMGKRQTLLKKDLPNLWRKPMGSIDPKELEEWRRLAVMVRSQHRPRVSESLLDEASSSDARRDLMAYHQRQNHDEEVQFCNIPAKILKALAKRDKTGAPVDGELADLIAEQAAIFRRVFSHYRTGSTMQKGDFLRFCDHSGFIQGKSSSEGTLQPADIDLIWIKSSQAHLVKEGSLAQLLPAQFTEAIIRIAAARYSDEPSLCRRVRRLVEEKIVSHARSSDADNWRYKLTSDDVQRVLAGHHKRILDCFKYWSGNDSKGLSLSKWKSMCSNLRITGKKSRVSVRNVEELFFATRHACPKYNQMRGSRQATRKMKRKEFFEVVAALAVFEHPSPHDSLAQRIHTFCVKKLLESHDKFVSNHSKSHTT
eukprot:g3113.t1